MTRKGGGMFADGYNQLATAQSLQRSLDSTLRETGHFGERAHLTILAGRGTTSYGA